MRVGKPISCLTHGMMLEQNIGGIIGGTICLACTLFWRQKYICLFYLFVEFLFVCLFAAPFSKVDYSCYLDHASAMYLSYILKSLVKLVFLVFYKKCLTPRNFLVRFTHTSRNSNSLNSLSHF